MKAKLRKLRVRVFQIFGHILIIFICVSTSAWEKISPLTGTILFFIGVILVVIASIGRIWCRCMQADLNPTKTITFTTIIALVFALYYPLVIKSEEHKLKKQYGEIFNNYVSITPRFIPKLSLLNEPATYVVNPKIFKKDLYQALWFIWAIGLLEIIEELHDLGIMPKIFNIY